MIVKAHESHPGTHALVAKAIQTAAEKTGMPAGVFASVYGQIPEGQTLVKHPLVKSVAFTGSFRGGKALYDAAAARPEPIPVFAEMGSINPVILLEKTLAVRGKAVAEMYAGSVTMECPDSFAPIPDC
ncbi:MAG: aldehyde dehydrogenase family protein [Bacteroidia bacterium]